jgi:hypothetical protein
MLTVSSTGCVKVYGSPDGPEPAVLTPESPPAASFDRLAARTGQATEDASANGLRSAGSRRAAGVD